MVVVVCVSVSGCVIFDVRFDITVDGGGYGGGGVCEYVSVVCDSPLLF